METRIVPIIMDDESTTFNEVRFIDPLLESERLHLTMLFGIPFMGFSGGRPYKLPGHIITDGGRIIDIFGPACGWQYAKEEYNSARENFMLHNRKFSKHDLVTPNIKNIRSYLRNYMTQWRKYVTCYMMIEFGCDTPIISEIYNNFIHAKIERKPVVCIYEHGDNITPRLHIYLMDNKDNKMCLMMLSIQKLCKTNLLDSICEDYTLVIFEEIISGPFDSEFFEDFKSRFPNVFNSRELECLFSDIATEKNDERYNTNTCFEHVKGMTAEEILSKYLDKSPNQYVIVHRSTIYQGQSFTKGKKY